MLLLHLVLAGAAVATGAPQDVAWRPVFGGQGVGAAVERASGRVAVSRAGKIEIFANAADSTPVAMFPAPAPDARVTEYKGHTLVVWHIDPGQPWGGKIVLTDDGKELVRWTTEEHVFPGTSTRLTEDGAGLVAAVPVEAQSRAELKLPASIPDGVTVVVTQRLSDGARRFFVPRALAGATGRQRQVPLQDEIGLTPDEIVACFNDGVVMRVSTSQKLFETKVGEENGGGKITDVDVTRGVAVLVERPQSGIVVGFDLHAGKRLWKWDGAEKKDEIERFVGQTRGKNALGRWLGVAEEQAMRMDPRGVEPEKAKKHALAMLYGAEDARILPDGRLLVVGGKASREAYQPWIGVVDITTGKLDGSDLLDRMTARGNRNLVDFLHSRKVPSSHALSVLPDGTLLLQGRDGYYRTGVTN